MTHSPDTCECMLSPPPAAASLPLRKCYWSEKGVYCPWLIKGWGLPWANSRQRCRLAPAFHSCKCQRWLPPPCSHTAWGWALLCCSQRMTSSACLCRPCAEGQGPARAPSVYVVWTACREGSRLPSLHQLQQWLPPSRRCLPRSQPPLRPLAKLPRRCCSPQPSAELWCEVGRAGALAQLRRGMRWGWHRTPAAPEAVHSLPCMPCLRDKSDTKYPNTEGRVPNTHLPSVKPQELWAHYLAQITPSLGWISCCVISPSF